LDPVQGLAAQGVFFSFLVKREGDLLEVSREEHPGRPPGVGRDTQTANTDGWKPRGWKQVEEGGGTDIFGGQRAGKTGAGRAVRGE